MRQLTVGITGMVGFIGSHLYNRLKREEGIFVPPFEDDFFSDRQKLEDYLIKCDTVVHLAAMNRGNEEDLYRTNVDLVNKLVSTLEDVQSKPHVIFSSSTQIDRDNPYGKSKREGANILQGWAERSGASLTIMVIPNVFGSCCRPFYNSVIATFCYQLTHGQEPKIIIDDQLSLIYAGELTEIITERIKNPPAGIDTVWVNAGAKIKVSEILVLLEKFKEYYFSKKLVPRFENDFERDLYNTLLSYMDVADYKQQLTLHSDSRGSLFEVVKQAGGQIFFSTTKPAITRGNHYHTRKIEKFCVVKGQATIRIRKIGTAETVEYKVSGDDPVVVEIPVFYTHNITNTGDGELLTLFWTNEVFDPSDTDTFYEEV